MYTLVFSIIFGLVYSTYGRHTEKSGFDHSSASQRRELNQILDKIFKNAVVLDNEKKKEANEVLQKFLKTRLIEEMKNQNEIFRNIYQRIFYTGSYYDGLKIGEPDEFDINVVLKLPKSLYMSDLEGRPGYKYYVTNDYPGKYERLFQLSQKDGKHYLIPEKLMSWLQGVIDKSLKAIINEKQFSTYRIREVKCSRSGPAWTLHLNSTNSYIDIDFVPVFSYIDNDNDEIFMVPKPPSGNDKDVKRLWRLSFAVKERKEMKKLDNVGQSSFKKITKLLKYLRDKQGAPLKKIASFYIKNFMLLEKRDNNEVKWNNEKYLGKYFCMLLKNLHDTLQSGYMPSYFVKGLNILESIRKQRSKTSSSALENIVGFLRRISKNIDKDPLKYVPKYFKFKNNVRKSIESASKIQGQSQFSSLQANKKNREESKSLSNVAIAGITIGIVLGLFLLIILIFKIYKRNRNNVVEYGIL